MSIVFIAFVVPFLMLVIVGVIVLLVVFRGRSKPSSVPAGGPSGWFAEVIGVGAGALGGSTYGTMTISDGQLNYFPDGDGEPWSVPAASLRARKRNFFDLAGADVELHGPMGEVRCNVSREHINRFITNDLKDLRQRGYTDEFLAALAANGATLET